MPFGRCTYAIVIKLTYICNLLCSVSTACNSPLLTRSVVFSSSRFIMLQVSHFVKRFSYKAIINYQFGVIVCYVQELKPHLTLDLAKIALERSLQAKRIYSPDSLLLDGDTNNTNLGPVNFSTSLSNL